MNNLNKLMTEYLDFMSKALLARYYHEEAIKAYPIRYRGVGLEIIGYSRYVPTADNNNDTLWWIR